MNQLLDAFRLHNWYALVAIGLTFLLQAVRANSVPLLTSALNKLWFKVPDGWRWLVPVLTGAATAFTAAFAQGVSFQMALVAIVGGVLGIGTPSMGLHAALKESPANIDGGPGGKPLNPPA